MSVLVNTTDGEVVVVETTAGNNVKAVTNSGALVVTETTDGHQVNITTASVEAKAVTAAGYTVEVNAAGALVQVNVNGSIPMPFPVPGPQGDPGNITSYTAGAAIGSQRLVMLAAGKVIEYDQTDEVNAYKAVGFTITSVLNNAAVNVIHSGILNNPGWGLTPDAVYYANGIGGITATPPDTGISQAIGMALDSNNLFINIDEPYIL